MKTRNMKRMILMTLAGCTFLLILMMGTSIAFAAQGAASLGNPAPAGETSAVGLGYIGAAVATGLAAVGAGIGVGIAGASAIGAISEKPELLGRTLIYIGLAEGVAIYGLIISIMILGRL